MRGLVTAGRGVRLEGCRWSSDVGRHRCWPVVHSGVAGLLHAAGPLVGAGNGTRLFIRPRLLLLDRGGEGPAPAGQFTGDGDVRDDPAFVPGFELLPFMV